MKYAEFACIYDAVMINNKITVRLYAIFDSDGLNDNFKRLSGYPTRASVQKSRRGKKKKAEH